MKKILIAITVLWAAHSWAACTGSSPTWSSSADYASVSSCLFQATAGDTINVSSGDATWTSTLVINKSIFIIGAGSGVAGTKVTNNAGANTVEISLSNDVDVRISGFYFTQASNNTGYSTISLNGKTNGSFAYTKIRIDHNKIEKGTRAVFVRGWVESLIDNNTFVNCNIAIGFSGDNDYSWSRAISAGTPHATFIEDNTFIMNNDAGRELNEQIYHQEGARSVVRYNTFDGSQNTAYPTHIYDTHGNGSNCKDLPKVTVFRGQPINEFYNNTVLIRSAYRMMNIRGGSNIVHNNTVTISSGAPTIILTDEECWTSGGPWAGCSPIATSWPAWDQVTNSFFWNNTSNGSPFNPSVSGDNIPFIQVDRDYFLHAPAATGGKSTYPDVPGANTMTFSSAGANAYYPYTPYTYPHPLRGEGSEDPDPEPTGSILPWVITGG